MELEFKKMGPAKRLCSPNRVGNYTSKKTSKVRKCLILDDDSEDYVFLSETKFGDDLKKAFTEGIVYKIVGQDTLVVSTGGITIETLKEDLG
jgi:hypothetical protein